MSSNKGVIGPVGNLSVKRVSYSYGHFDIGQLADQLADWDDDQVAVPTDWDNWQPAPWSWLIKNTLRWSFIWGWLVNNIAKLFSKVTGVPTITSELEVTHIKANGDVIHYGVVGRRVVTNTGVAFLVDDWDDDSQDITDMHFHGCGTGAVAENAADAALGAESDAILNPNNTRATGVEDQPAANQLRTVGTLIFDGGGAITEHGIFDQAATGGGVLWDRTVFGAVNVVALDSIQFTYVCTITAGG